MRVPATRSGVSRARISAPGREFGTFPIRANYLDIGSRRPLGMAVVGGLAGKGVAESIDPTRELTYWRENYKTRPYADKATAFDEYESAYGYGVSSYTKYPGRSFDDVDSDLSRDWNASRGKSTLAWDRARFAARDAWDRVSTHR